MPESPKSNPRHHTMTEEHLKHLRAKKERKKEEIKKHILNKAAGDEAEADIKNSEDPIMRPPRKRQLTSNERKRKRKAALLEEEKKDVDEGLRMHGWDIRNGNWKVGSVVHERIDFPKNESTTLEEDFELDAGWGEEARVYELRTAVTTVDSIQWGRSQALLRAPLNSGMNSS